MPSYQNIMDSMIKDIAKRIAGDAHSNHYKAIVEGMKRVSNTAYVKGYAAKQIDTDKLYDINTGCLINEYLDNKEVKPGLRLVSNKDEHKTN